MRMMALRKRARLGIALAVAVLTVGWLFRNPSHPQAAADAGWLGPRGRPLGDVVWGTPRANVSDKERASLQAGCELAGLDSADDELIH